MTAFADDMSTLSLVSVMSLLEYLPSPLITTSDGPGNLDELPTTIFSEIK